MKWRRGADKPVLHGTVTTSNGVEAVSARFSGVGDDGLDLYVADIEGPLSSVEGITLDMLPGHSTFMLRSDS